MGPTARPPSRVTFVVLNGNHSYVLGTLMIVGHGAGILMKRSCSELDLRLQKKSLRIIFIFICFYLFSPSTAIMALIEFG